MKIDEKMIQAQCLVLLVALRDNGPMATAHDMFCGSIADKALARLLRSGWVGLRNGRDAVYLTHKGEDESPLASLWLAGHLAHARVIVRFETSY